MTKNGLQAAPPVAIKIEDGIPIPRCGNGTTEILRAMEVGQSFIHPTTNKVTNVSGSLSSVAKATGRRFVSRTVIHDGNKVVRVWRVA